MSRDFLHDIGRFPSNLSYYLTPSPVVRERSPITTASVTRCIIPSRIWIETLVWTRRRRRRLPFDTIVRRSHGCNVDEEETIPENSKGILSKLVTVTAFHRQYVSPPVNTYLDSLPEVTWWMNDYIFFSSNGRKKSFVLLGPLLIRKTLWARSFGTHAFFPGLFMVEGFSPDDVK